MKRKYPEKKIQKTRIFLAGYFWMEKYLEKNPKTNLYSFSDIFRRMPIIIIMIRKDTKNSEIIKKFQPKVAKCYS